MTAGRNSIYEKWCVRAVLVGVCTWLASALSAQQPVIIEYAVPTAAPNLQQIIPGPDGNLWFVDRGGDTIGKITTAGVITEYPVPTTSSGLQAITSGPDGNLWFTEDAAAGGTAKIGSITLDGAITEYPVPGFVVGLSGIAAGPDGNIWFTERVASKIGKITTDGTITEYSFAYCCASPGAITAGPDGNLWFTNVLGNCAGKIGKITASGTITEYDVPTACASPSRIVQGPDGNLWFTEAAKIAKITTTGVITEYPANSPGGITLGPDGNLWFSEGAANRIGRITAGGDVAEFPIPPASSSLYSIVQGPDGNLWFTEPFGNKIAKVALPVCAYALSTTRLQVPASGGTFTIDVRTDPSCTWAVTGLPYWITTIGDSAGTGSGEVTVNVDANNGGARGVTLSIAGFPITVSQSVPICNALVISPNQQSFTAAGGPGLINVGVFPLCTSGWSVSGAPPWVTITKVNSAPNNGSVSYTVAANSGRDRGAVLTVAGIPFFIGQQAAANPDLSFIGSMAHVAAEENWTTTFTLVNKSSVSAQTRLDFYADSGSPMALPVSFPQQPSANSILASVDRTLGPNASLLVEASGPSSAPVQVGSAQLGAARSVDGFAIFHLIPNAQEAVVPLETRNASSYLLAFDNTNGIALGIAVENVAAQVATIPVVIRDDGGVQIGSDSLVVPGNGHTSFVLSAQFPVTSGKRGTIELDTPAGGQISVLGIRFTPPGTLTTIPALTNLVGPLSPVPHVASGNGWQTTFLLVNMGTSAAQVHLKFFDDNGSSLLLPISFPQSGGTPVVAPAVDQILPAGASLTVESTGPSDSPLQSGSAQLTTDEPVSGFAIFRYNPTGQEAVVPINSRTANTWLLPFDNTNGTSTGVALTNVSAQAANIPVLLRDETGAQIGAGSIPLAGNGHSAFTLGVDKFPVAASIRGTIEFDTPSGGQISVVGIRMPSTHTFTTLPALPN